MSNIKTELHDCDENRYPVLRRSIWAFQVMCAHINQNTHKKFMDGEKLIKKDGTFSDDVQNFMDKIEFESNNNWTLAYYKNLIAFKNPADRVTYIYDEKYFKSRFTSSDDSIFKCKSIKFD